MAGPAKPKPDYKDKDRQATTRDGEPIWTVRLDAIDHDRDSVRMYRLPPQALDDVEHLGVPRQVDPRGPIVI